MIAKLKFASTALCFGLVLCSLSSEAADSNDGSVFVNAKQIKWGDAPPNLPPGAKLAVLYGDPGKAEPYTIRLMLPADYHIAPHWHTLPEQLTIISGAFYIGMGDKANMATAHALLPGGFHFLPSKAHHFAATKVPTVVQVNGIGPFDINYLNPADDPTKQK